MIKRIKDQKAITLIALIITIIVLLILAGVTIVTLTGDNGLLKKAADSSIQTIIGEEKEGISIGWNSQVLENLGDVNKITKKSLEDQMKSDGKNVTVKNVNNDENSDFKVTYIESGNTYIISKRTGEFINYKKFSVNGREYSFLEGMTWEDWVSSECNTDNFTTGDYNWGPDNQFFLVACSDGWVNKDEDYVGVDSRSYIQEDDYTTTIHISIDISSVSSHQGETWFNGPIQELFYNPQLIASGNTSMANCAWSGGLNEFDYWNEERNSFSVVWNYKTVDTNINYYLCFYEGFF